MAALAAGLTMGLVSIDPMELDIIVKTEDKDLHDEQERSKLMQDQAAAEKLLPLTHGGHHQLLVTLLLMNSLANEALPLFLDQVVPSWMAVMLSVSFVLVFGEIIPSAVFTGSEQLSMAARFAGLVGTMKFLLCPIAAPIAMLLDAILGADHKGRYNFAELRAIVGLHAKLHTGGEHKAVFKSHDEQGYGIITTESEHHFTSDSAVIFTETPSVPAKSTKLELGEVYYPTPCKPLQGRDKKLAFQLFRSPERGREDLITFARGELSSGVFALQERDEIKIMHGVMSLTHMRADEAVVPLSQAYMLEKDQAVNMESLRNIDKHGHSRIPVFERSKHNVRGYILVKKLIVVTPEKIQEGLTFGDLELMSITLVPPDMLMLDLLNKFQEDKCHLGLVVNDPEAVEYAWRNGLEIPPDVHMMGIITLEDVIEKLIQEKIEDESDPDASGHQTRDNSNKCVPGSSPWRLGVTPRSSQVDSPAESERDVSGSLSEPLLPQKRHFKADTMATHLGIPSWELTRPPEEV